MLGVCCGNSRWTDCPYFPATMSGASHGAEQMGYAQLRWFYMVDDVDLGGTFERGCGTVLLWRWLWHLEADLMPRMDQRPRWPSVVDGKVRETQLRAPKTSH